LLKKSQERERQIVFPLPLPSALRNQFPTDPWHGEQPLARVGVT
jgi:hypothetical protein